jgi:hypothetical protein
MVHTTAVQVLSRPASPGVSNVTTWIPWEFWGGVGAGEERLVRGPAGLGRSASSPANGCVWRTTGPKPGIQGAGA